MTDFNEEVLERRSPPFKELIPRQRSVKAKFDVVDCHKKSWYVNTIMHATIACPGRQHSKPRSPERFVARASPRYLRFGDKLIGGHRRARLGLGPASYPTPSTVC